MPLLDFSTLVLIIAAALHIGLLGVFGVDALAAVFGSHVNAASGVIGFAGVWQLMRQRFQ